MTKDKEKMLVDMLSYLTTHPKAGSNKIGRFLADKGYSPLYQSGHYSGSMMVHPKKVQSVLKQALDERLIVSEYPLGQVPKGKPNRFNITKKGKNCLERKGMIRFIENSDISEIGIPLVTIERALLKAEEDLDKSALKVSTPLGPGDLLTSEEDGFLVQEHIRITARRLLASWKMKFLVPENSRSIELSESEVEDFCLLMAAYDNGKTAFSFVLTYDPSYYDLKANPRLFENLSRLFLEGFATWLCKFKGMAKEEVGLLIPLLFCKQEEANTELSRKLGHLDAMWKEYVSKSESTKLKMYDVRRFANKVFLDYERLRDFVASPEGIEFTKRFRNLLENREKCE